MSLKIKLSLLAFLFGFISLFLETLSFTVTYLYVVESSHVASLVLSAFLCGIAASALAIRKKISDNYEQMSLYLIVITGVIVFYSSCFYLVPSILGVFINFNNSLYSSPITNLISIWVFLFVPGFIIGATFPLLIEMQKRFAEKYISVSTIYAIDVIGGTFGTLIAGFFMIPEYGIKTSLLLVVIVSIATFFIASLLVEKNRKFMVIGITYTIILSLFLFLNKNIPTQVSSGKDEIIKNNSKGNSDTIVSEDELSIKNLVEYIPYDNRFGKILFQEPSEYGFITISELQMIEDSLENGTLRRLFINYRGMCNSIYNSSEKFIANTTINNMPRRGRVLSIGLGCGYTLKALTSSDAPSSIDLYEINSVIAENSLPYFFSEDENPLRDERLNLVVKDGLYALRESEEGQYDAIVIDVEEPGIIQSSPMYSYEYFTEMKRVLSDDGVLALWAIWGTERYNKILYKTLSAVFPNTYIVHDDSGSVQLFASKSEIEIQGGQKYTDQELSDIPINMLYENVLQDSYSIYKSFSLPDHFEDPFIEK